MTTTPYRHRWFHEAMLEFERLVHEGHILIPSCSLDREPAELARQQRYYQHGDVNLAFIGFLQGLTLGRLFWNQFEEVKP